MGCNCGRSATSSASVRWVYTDQNGVETEYLTENGAKRAMIRNGGQGSVRQRLVV